MVKLSSGIVLNPNDLTSEDREAIVKALEETKDQAWKPKVGKTYWYTNGDQCTNYTYWAHSDNVDSITDQCRLEIGNVFPTKEAVEKHLTYLKALQVLRGDTKGYEWKKGEPYRYVYYSDDARGLKFGFHNMSIHSDVVKFKTDNDALDSLQVHESEWRIVLLGVE